MTHNIHKHVSYVLQILATFYFQKTPNKQKMTQYTQTPTALEYSIIILLNN